MPVLLDDVGPDALPVTPLRKGDLETWTATARPQLRSWVKALGFEAEPGTVCVCPGADGLPERVLAGVPDEPSPWDWAAIAARLPAGPYRLSSTATPDALERAALGWGLAGYRFDRYRTVESRPQAMLDWPAGIDHGHVMRTIEATVMVRDLVNTPAADLGPAELAGVATHMAQGFGAEVRVLAGDELPEAGFPAVHAVGRSSPRPPHFIDIAWGPEDGPRITLVGKGVCFDTGGLDIKPASAMKLMKKDMAGAAHALAVARMVMGADLPVRLRVLIPAVDNCVSGDALRPLDVVRTRSGKTIEIGHTDAEGRVVLSDALALAASESPAAIVDFATLTGAARVALGPSLPALFCNDDALAAELLECGLAEADPLWRLPLHGPYRNLIDGKTADITNASESPYAGAITAALFLAEFVPPEVPWAHLDLMAWNVDSRPGRPEGGEAMGLRAVYAMVANRTKS